MSTATTGWKEIIPEGEAARLEVLAKQLNDLQRKRATNGKANRALHAKGLAGVEAEFTVLPDLPERARAGLFQRPGTYRAYVRFSNGAGQRRRDTTGDVRGLAIKVTGVEGKKIIPGLEGAKTQDFLLIQSPTTPFKDAEEFMWLVRAMTQPALLPLKAIFRFGPGKGLRMLKKLVAGVSRPVPSMATARYYSAVPVQLGREAIHYALEPNQRSEPGAGNGTSPDYLTEELAARLAKGPVSFDFRVQFFKDEATTPIEDASVEWTEEHAPFVTIGRLTIPAQDLRSPRGARVTELVERLSFDPWHATEDLRPLGNMMRARNAAYRLSVMERGAAPEPDGSERFD